MARPWSPTPILLVHLCYDVSGVPDVSSPSQARKQIGSDDTKREGVGRLWRKRFTPHCARRLASEGSAPNHVFGRSKITKMLFRSATRIRPTEGRQDFARRPRSRACSTPDREHHRPRDRPGGAGRRLIAADGDRPAGAVAAGERDGRCAAPSALVHPVRFSRYGRNASRPTWSVRTNSVRVTRRRNV